MGKKKKPTKKSATTQTTVVCYVRHGHTPTTGSVLPGRAKGLHLSSRGQDQANAVAERIGKFGNIAAVYSSPMERTRETAQPIARACGLRTRVRQGLIEADFGTWTGKKLTYLRKLPEWDKVQKTPSNFRFPSGESFLEIQSRMIDTVAKIVADHQGEVVVAVSHADTIKATIAAALGTPLDLFQRIHISPCSLSVVLYSQSGPMVLAVNTAGDDLDSVIPMGGSK
ncbi:MAG: phosphoglycerate mutase [Acidimicrobiaceae bacterium]|nr:phosphoglycerate mutase [Acidimicrobiaceae bacterium]|tara:strand:- start:347 stop:1024 length:678 start_codon:yes stop_codon:yes gene_type:complete